MMKSKAALRASTCFIFIALLFIFVKAIHDGPDQSPLVGIIGGLLVVFVVLVGVGARSNLRLQRIQRSSGTAFVSNIAAYYEFNLQLIAVCALFDITFRGVRPSYLSISLNSENLKVFGGLWNPKQLVAIPMASAQTIQLQTTAQGRWNLAGVELSFPTGKEPLPLDLILTRNSLGMPFVSKAKSLVPIIEDLQKYLGKNKNLPE